MSDEHEMRCPECDELVASIAVQGSATADPRDMLTARSHLVQPCGHEVRVTFGEDGELILQAVAG